MVLPVPKNVDAQGNADKKTSPATTIPIMRRRRLCSLRFKLNLASYCCATSGSIGSANGKSILLATERRKEGSGAGPDIFGAASYEASRPDVVGASSGNIGTPDDKLASGSHEG